MLTQVNEDPSNTPSPSASNPAPPMIVVRRRRRRRSGTGEQQIDKKALARLLFGFAAAFFVVAVKPVRQFLTSFARQFIHLDIPVEYVAFGLAALGMIFLVPGVEDTVLRKLGLKRDRRRSRNSRR